MLAPTAAVSMAAISMAVISMAVWLAVTVAAAQAGFLYVPQDEAAPRAIDILGEPAALRAGATLREDTPAAVEVPGSFPARQSAAPATGTEEPGPDRWRVHPGEMLRDALARWGGDAGVEVMFLTDRRYRLHEGRRFHGSFGEASQALLAALSHLPQPPVGEIRAGGGTLAVLHRVSPHRAGGGQ